MSSIKQFKHIKYDIYNECHLNITLPEKEAFPLLIYFHGGGLEGGPFEEFDDYLAKPLAENGIGCVNVQYRMYPNAKYPEFVEDAAKAVSWVVNNISEYGNAKKIFIGGSSAGCYLTELLFFDKKYLAKYNLNRDEFAGYVFNAGQPTTHFNVLRERGEDTRRVIIDESAPLFYIEQVKDHPPLVFLYAENDMPNRFEQTQLMINTLKIFGYDFNKIIVKKMLGYEHCAYDFPENGQLAKFTIEVIKFIETFM